jgi:hypothetical protein
MEGLTIVDMIQIPGGSVEQERPIACTLSATDRETLVQRWQELARVTSRVLEPGRVTASYTVDRESVRTLEALVEAERQCCGFADFALTYDQTTATLVITGPVGTEEFFDCLFRTPEPPATP